MDLNPATGDMLAPNERARTLNSQNRFALFKKIIIIILVIAFIFTILFVFSVINKKSSPGMGTIPPALAAFPTFPDAKVSNTAEKVDDKSKTYKVVWEIENKNTDEVASWYTSMLSDDDAEERYEVVEAPDDYKAEEIRVVYKLDGKLYIATFTQSQNKTIVTVEHSEN